MPIIDQSSKLVVGHALGDADNTELALEAWRSAKKTLKSYGPKTEGLIVHRDQDGVYLGHVLLYELAVLDKARFVFGGGGERECPYGVVQRPFQIREPIVVLGTRRPGLAEKSCRSASSVL